MSPDVYKRQVYNVYRAMNQNTPVVDKLVSVVAEVEHPVTVRVPIGTTIEETVRLAGANTTKNPVYFIGGPMMGNIGSGSQPVTKTTNAVLVLPEEHLIVQRKRQKTSIDLKRAAASCCQCTMSVSYTHLCYERTGNLQHRENDIGRAQNSFSLPYGGTCLSVQSTYLEMKIHLIQ